ncbi:MAG TPA: hypothetical protein VNG71_22620 [Pyrinomonadaceae bacterium]|nr:hypothetical protein [Pyrinomonadaceae bacterium]
MGEPDETTRVIPPRFVPKTKVNVAVPRFETLEKGREPWALGTGALVIGAVIVLILGGAITLALMEWSRQSSEPRNTSRPAALNTVSPTRSPTPNPTPTRTQPTITITPQEQPSFEQQPVTPSIRETIVDSTFPVGPRAYQSYSFTVAANRLGNLTGTFSATGGRNDIDAWVIDANQMANFANGHSTHFYYHSDYVSYGEINLRLKPGAYYVIFSNRTALLTNKVVTAQIYLN